MNEEFEALIHNDFYLIFKKLSELDPISFKNSISNYSKDGTSLFLKYIQNNQETEQFYSCFDLFEKNGYNLLSKSYVSKKIPLFIKNSHTTNDKLEIPEYITLLSFISNDEIAYFLTNKLGKEKILQLEKDGWNIIDRLFSVNARKTIELVFDYGIKETKNTVFIAERSEDLLNFYWSFKNSNQEKMSDEQFSHLLKLIDKKISKNYKNQKEIVMSTFSLIENKQSVLSKEQNLSILKFFMEVSDKDIFTKYFKLMLKKSIVPKEEIIEFIEKNIFTFNNPRLLVEFLSENTFHNNDINDIYSYFSTNHLALQKEYYGKPKFHNSFMDKVKTLNINILDENRSFNIKNIISKYAFFSCFFDSLNINPTSNPDLFESLRKNSNSNLIYNFSQDEVLELRNLFSNTWFKKENDKFLIEYIDLIGSLPISKLFLFDTKILSNKSIINIEQKEAFFLTLLSESSDFKNVCDSYNSHNQQVTNSNLLIFLFNELKSDLNTNWEKIEKAFPEKYRTTKMFKEVEFLTIRNELDTPKQNIKVKTKI